MSVEIPGFSDLGREFEQRLIEERAIREQLEGTRQVALEAWEQMEQARQFALEDILKKGDLGLCSSGSIGHGWEETEQERLGIFPRQQLRYLYIHEKDGEYSPTLYAACTFHYQDDLRNHKENDEALKSRWLLSEVKNRKGRLVTVIDSIDVTDMPLQYKVGMDMDMEKVFQYFDLPQLPPRPIFPA